MSRNRRKPNARRLSTLSHHPRENFALPWGCQNESWRVREIASQLEQIAARARALADRYEMRYRGPEGASDEYSDER
jgi:hypothetical protein